MAGDETSPPLRCAAKECMPGLSSPVAAAQFIVAGQQGFR